MNITLSHISMLRLLTAIGKNFDAQVVEWRDSFIPELNDLQVYDCEIFYSNYVCVFSNHVLAMYALIINICRILFLAHQTQ